MGVAAVGPLAENPDQRQDRDHRKQSEQRPAMPGVRVAPLEVAVGVGPDRRLAHRTRAFRRARVLPCQPSGVLFGAGPRGLPPTAPS